MKLLKLAQRTLLALTLAATSLAWADNKPLEWVLGYAAGGGSDVVARTVAVQLQKELDRTVMVENKPGAATNIAASYTANSKNFGNILFTADFATLAANPWLFSKLPYDPDGDFTPVGMLARFPLLLIVPANSPVHNFKEFAAWVQAQQGTVGFASAGVGSAHHLAGELLRERTGLKLVHVPYKGAGPAIADLMGGQVPCGVIDTASANGALTSGKVRAIGVASLKRLASFPDIPTLDEQGVKGFEAYAWQGVVVPKGTAAKDIAAFSKALQKALASQPVQDQFKTMALEGFSSTPQQMTDYVKAEKERWGKVIRANNIKLE
jgi:tripartite-type tricarboxylate transporter receptor subunit TctC